MTETIPDGPTDPRLAAMADSDNHTTIVTPGYGSPLHTGSTAPTPYSRPPIVPGPPGPVGSPIVPVTEHLEQPSGRIYTSEHPILPPAPEVGADRGKTSIADDVVERVIEKIVDLTTEEVDGVDGLHTGPDTERAVTVKLDGYDATIDVAIRVKFGHAVHEVVEKVRASIIGQSERLLGLTVTEVNVLVGDVTFEETTE